PAGTRLIAGNDVVQLVAVHNFTLAIPEADAIPVAIASDAEIGPLGEHAFLQRLRLRRTHLVVDIEAVGFGAHRDDGGTQFVQHGRRNVISGAMRAIDDDFDAAQIEVTRHGAFAKLDVTTGCVIDTDNLAQLRRGYGRHRLINLALDFQLDIVRQLGAFAGEKLDAVVLVGIVRGADDNAGLGVECAGQVGDGGSGHRAEQRYIRARRNEAGLQRRLEHIAGNARVLADDDLAATGAGKHLAGRPAQLEYEFGIDRPLADRAAHAIGAEITSAHIL